MRWRAPVRPAAVQASGLARAALLALAPWAFLLVTGCSSEPARPPTPATYPAAWEVEVPTGTQVAALKARFEPDAARLPAGDLEDHSPVPPWFRAYLRASFPGLPAAGPYQYPHYARDILHWMLQNPDLATPTTHTEPRRPGASRITVVDNNVPLPNGNAANTESAIARNPANPHHLIAAANSRVGGAAARQRQFHSADSGKSWTASNLPLSQDRVYHGDPSVAYSSDGSTAWTSTLGFRTNGNGASVWVQLYRSTDQGQTWTHRANVSEGSSKTSNAANDKPMMWVDNHPGSPFKDRIYLAWNVLNWDENAEDWASTGVHFAYSSDGGLHWSHAVLTSANATGVHLATGPKGELYVAWAEPNARAIRMVNSTNGGASFSAARLIALTNRAYRTPIPAMCRRWAMTYVTLGVDRSTGGGGVASKWAPVHAAWTDHDGSPLGAPCNSYPESAAGSTRVYFSSSLDGGGNWSAPKVPALAHAPSPAGDQFNHWMDVDPFDGSIHLAMNDTREDPARLKAHVYYLYSRDRGASWSYPVRVTDAPTDETAPGAAPDQYGDYNGLSALSRLAIASWTDRRDPGTKEQIYIATMRNVLLAGCLRRPEGCFSPAGRSRGRVVLNCPRLPCRVVDPLPEHCLVSTSCPACTGGGQCPRRYRLKFDGIGGWDVGLVGPNGEPVRHKAARTPAGVELTFEAPGPVPRSLRESDYALTFDLGAGGRAGVDYTVHTALEALD